MVFFIFIIPIGGRKMKNFKKILIFIAIIFMTFTWTACSNAGNEEKANNENTTGETTETAYPLTITDDLGNEVTFEKAPEKIISVAASNTEILFALGLGDQIIGRDEYSYYPEEAKEIEVVGDYSGPNTELIIDLAPEVVFAQSSVPDDIKQLLESSGIKVVIFNPSDIDGVLNNIETVGQIANVQEEAKKLIDNMENKRQEIVEKAEGVEERKVFIDLGDFYSVGPNSFIDSMLQEINVVNIAGEADTPYPEMSLEKIIEANPDVYITTFTPEEEIKKIEGIESINAFKNNSIIEIPSGTPENDMIQRPGSRVVDGLEIYAKAIYPEAFEDK